MSLHINCPLLCLLFNKLTTKILLFSFFISIKANNFHNEESNLCAFNTDDVLEIKLHTFYFNTRELNQFLKKFNGFR